MFKLKLIILLSISFFINDLYANTSNYKYCKNITKNDIKKILNHNKSQYIRNPFDLKMCVPILVNNYDDLELKLSDFYNSKSLYKIYVDFLKENNETMVLDISLSNNKKIKLFKFKENSTESQKLKENFLNNKFLEKHYNSFIFFHEIMHLSERSDFDFKIESKREAVADIGSILIISVLNNLKIEETINLLNSVYKVRRKNAKYEMGRTDQKGDLKHYNKHAFLSSIRNLKEMKKNGYSLINENRNLELHLLIKKMEKLAYKIHK